MVIFFAVVVGQDALWMKWRMQAQCRTPVLLQYHVFKPFMYYDGAKGRDGMAWLSRHIWERITHRCVGRKFHKMLSKYILQNHWRFGAK
jgi:hypothetical protein